MNFWNCKLQNDILSANRNNVISTMKPEIKCFLKSKFLFHIVL